MNIKKIINWKIYGILLTASMLSVIAILPYALSLQGDIISQIPIPLPMVLLLSVIQNGIIFAVLIFLGLFLGNKLGFGLKYGEEYLTDRKITGEMKDMFKKSVFLGVGTGVGIVIMDVFFKQIGIVVGSELSIPLWQGALASFYGGISEEIVLRLFFMTFIVFLLHKVLKPNTEGNVKHSIIWASIIIAAILFGLGHLPAVASITDLTSGVILRTIALNAVGGIVFGYLYWKNGLESAMIAHFSADIILHVFFPMMILMYPS